MMTAFKDNTFRCPSCGAPLFVSNSGKSLTCSGKRTHCFDISSTGYVNLSLGKGDGDTKGSVRSRTEFLSKGYYMPISDTICEMLSKYSEADRVIDAGCGEGYYTNRAAKLATKEMYGIDLSKSAIQSASKAAKRLEIGNAFYAVAGIYSLPFADNFADAVINVFAPCSEKEFARVLKPNGLLLVAMAGENHLLGLKSILYDNVYLNEERADLPCGMEMLEERELNYIIKIDNNADIINLFSMTPYYYRTSKSGKEKLRDLESLETLVNVRVLAYTNRKGITIK